VGKGTPYRVPDKYRRSTGNKRYQFDDTGLAALVSFVYLKGWEDRDAIECKRKAAEEGPLKADETLAGRHEKHRLDIPSEILASRVVQVGRDAIGMMRSESAKRRSKLIGLDGASLVVPSEGKPN